MGERTGIEWTHHTFNMWRGCQKVSPGCANCYAEKLSKRNPKTLGEWGPNGVRAFATESYWAEPLKWDRAARNAGERRRVFCASLSDVFEDRPELQPHRDRLLDLIRQTTALDWLLLTKRPENIQPMLRATAYASTIDGRREPVQLMCDRWLRGQAPHNVWLGTSVENQVYAEERIPELLKVAAPAHFLSCEPFLGPLNLLPWMPAGQCKWFCQFCGKFCNAQEDKFGHITCPWCETVDYVTGSHVGNGHRNGQPIDLVIGGGESGPNARPCHPDWVRSLRDQCIAAGVSFFWKQWGEWAPDDRVLSKKNSRFAGVSGNIFSESPLGMESQRLGRIGKRAAGRMLDGRIWDEMPSPQAVTS